MLILYHAGFALAHGWVGDDGWFGSVKLPCNTSYWFVPGTVQP